MESVKFEDTDLPNIIELKNVKQCYDDPKKGKVTVIDGLNLLIEDRPNVHQFVSILGPSGCGKTTILRYISGLQKPTSGIILIKDKEPSVKNPVNMVFQQYSSLPWLTVLDNVALGLKIAGIKKDERYEKALQMIKVVGLEGQEYKYAQYPTLSGGQLQRVAIARSLVTNTNILLLDEPFASLDSIRRFKMQELLIDIWTRLTKQGVDITFILVTHEISEAVYLSDDIFIMRANPGNIAENVKIDLPGDRNRDLKRNSKFIDLVYYIEDRMITINEK